MSIPQWYAGNVITADRLNARNTYVVVQNADQAATDTSFISSEIVVTFEPGAVYQYQCLISFTADRNNNFKWNWSGNDVTLASFTQAMDTGTNSGQNASRPVIFRRPGNATTRIAGGTSALDASPPVEVFQSAYDWGTLTTGSGTPTLVLQFGKLSDTLSDHDTILRGGNQTRFVYQRIA